MDQREAQKINKDLERVSPVGKRIYGLIREAHMTKADLRKRTSLPAKQIDDQLNSLASYNLIKSIKKGDKKNLKTWVLYHQKEQEQQEQMKASNEDLISLILKKDSTVQTLKKQAIKNSYNLQNLQQILEMLKMKGDIFINGDHVKRRTMQKLYVPCVKCELKRLCSPNNTISPQNCPYLTNW